MPPGRGSAAQVSSRSKARGRVLARESRSRGGFPIVGEEPGVGYSSALEGFEQRLRRPERVRARPAGVGFGGGPRSRAGRGFFFMRSSLADGSAGWRPPREAPVSARSERPARIRRVRMTGRHRFGPPRIASSRLKGLPRRQTAAAPRLVLSRPADSLEAFEPRTRPRAVQQEALARRRSRRSRRNSRVEVDPGVLDHARS